jgi:hypothetical protein
VEIRREVGLLFGDAVTVDVLEDDDLVLLLLTGLDVRVERAAHDPKTAAGVPVHVGGVGDGGLVGEEIDLRTLDQLEGLKLGLYRGVGDVAKAVLGGEVRKSGDRQSGHKEGEFGRHGA